MEPKLVEIEGKTYCTKHLSGTIILNGKRSACEHIDSPGGLHIRKPEELHDSMILHVKSPTEVALVSGLVDERSRETLMVAEAIVNEFCLISITARSVSSLSCRQILETEDLKNIKMVAGNTGRNHSKL